MSRMTCALAAAVLAASVAALLPLQTALAQEPVYPPPTWELSECWFDTAVIEAGAIRCGYVLVPENRKAADGRMIRLAVAVADPVSPDSPRRPVVLLHGGPGIASVPGGRGIPLLRRWVGDRPVVIFDVRGVGETGPIMCPALRITESDIAARDLTLDEADTLERGAYLACRDEVLNQGIDLTAFNTAAIARDLRDIREALGYPEWDVVGGSAGAWVARNALREDPEGVRSATMLGGSGLEATRQLTHEVPFTARALGYVFAGCEADAACSARYPRLEEMFYRTYARLLRDPWTLPVDSRLFRRPAFTVNAQDYIRSMYRLLGDRDIMHIPAVVAAFHDRDEDVVRDVIEREYGGLSSTFSTGMATAVVCYDFHSSQYAAEYREAAAPYPSPLSDIRDWLAHCSDFLEARASAEERRSVLSEIPALIITGERDAMNPPVTWQDHHDLLPNGFHFTFPDAGHGFLLFNPIYQPCLNELITQFLAAPSRRPDDSCLAALPEREISTDLPEWAQERGTTAGSDPDRSTLELIQDQKAVQRPERLVFASFRPANWDIYHVAAPGEEPRRLTDHSGLDYDPALSPDGRWVVFTSERRGLPDLFVIDLERPKATPRLLIEGDVMEDQATFSPDGRTLFFVSTRDGSANIFSIPFRPDRTQSIADAVNLTRNSEGSFRPAVSPDGRRVVFSSDRGRPPGSPLGRLRGADLYVMGVDGGPARQLTWTDGVGWSGSPAWSADGASIYFYRREGGRVDARFGLWSVPAGGGEPRLVFEDTRTILSPAVGPDRRIRFAMGTAFSASPSAPPPSFSIWSVRPDGSDLAIESDPTRSYSAPSFALRGHGMVLHGPGPADLGPPQSEVAPLMGGPGPLLVPGAPWRRTLPDRELELYPVREFLAAALPSGDAMVRALPPGPRLVVSDLDGSRMRQLIDFDQAASPVMAVNGVTASPDGEWLVYMDGPVFGTPEDRVDLWKIRMDGSGAVNLTPDSPSNDGFPSFSPDGTWLAFRSGRTGVFDIFRMDADGGGVRNLTDHPARDAFPVVSPRGDLIAFSSDRDSHQPQLFEIYLLPLEPDGSPGAVRKITHNGMQNAHPYFSPDGEWVVFTSGMGGINDEEPLVQSFVFAPQMYGELYAYRLADGRLVRLTHDKWEDGLPTWATHD